MMMPVPESGCLIWLGATQFYGYGSVRYEGKNWKSSRLAWTLERGPIPEGMFVCHKCDVTPCCNVNHMFLGSHRDNMRDMIKKGRSKLLKTRGEQVNTAKLTDGKVIEIRKAHADGISCVKLGKIYGVSDAAINEAVNRKTWKHI